MMWVIIGYRLDRTMRSGDCCSNCLCYDCTIGSEDIEENVATFGTEKEAKDYIEWAKLKNPKLYGWTATTFRVRSLLGHYDSAKVEKYYPEPELPHNPEIK